MGFEKSPNQLIGEAMRDFARLEGHIDELLVSIYKKYPEHVPTTLIPLRYRPKIQRLIDCYRAFPLLRRFGLTDGSLDLVRIAFRLEEVFDHRNHMAHGDLTLTYTDETDTEYTFSRWIRDPESPGGLRFARYVTYKSHIIYLQQTARMLSTYFSDSIRHLNGEIAYDYYNQRARSQSRQREWWNNEGQYMNLKLQENLEGLNQLVRGEVG